VATVVHIVSSSYVVDVFLSLVPGKAVAETINEKLGAALGEILSEITKANAERDYAWRCVLLEEYQCCVCTPQTGHRIICNLSELQHLILHFGIAALHGDSIQNANITYLK
jgi:hypothetical protein